MLLLIPNMFKRYVLYLLWSYDGREADLKIVLGSNMDSEWGNEPKYIWKDRVQAVPKPGHMGRR